MPSRGITLLLGEARTGKTTVIREAIEKQSARIHCVHLHNPALTRAEFVEMLAAQFALSDRARTSKTDLLLASLNDYSDTATPRRKRQYS